MTQLQDIQDIPHHKYLSKFWSNTTLSITCKYSVKTVPDLILWVRKKTLLNQQHDWSLCCVRPMWANVGFGAWHNEVTRREGIKAMCQWVSIFKDVRKVRVCFLCFPIAQENKDEEELKEKGLSLNWGLYRKWNAREQFVNCFDLSRVHTPMTKISNINCIRWDFSYDFGWLMWAKLYVAKSRIAVGPSQHWDIGSHFCFSSFNFVWPAEAPTSAKASVIAVISLVFPTSPQRAENVR